MKGLFFCLMDLLLSFKDNVSVYRLCSRTSEYAMHISTDGDH